VTSVPRITSSSSASPRTMPPISTRLPPIVKTVASSARLAAGGRRPSRIDLE
jgi:hypothetical protein